MLKGSMVALITPFRNNAVDYETLDKLVDFHVENGTKAIIPCGTTGESATLSHEEHKKVISFVIKKVNKRVPVIAGTGSNSTQEAIELAKSAKESGADYHLAITPYYNKPTQEGLFQHFKAIAEAVDLPMLMYNVPGRTGVNMMPETVGRLAKVKNIVGLKEATGDLKQSIEIMENVPSGFSLISGDDFTNLPSLSVGGCGTISVTANILPRESQEMYDAWESGDIVKARTIHEHLMPVHRLMFVETSPIPVKTAAFMMGLIPVLEFRLPLCALKKENDVKLHELLKSRGYVL